MPHRWRAECKEAQIRLQGDGRSGQPMRSTSEPRLSAGDAARLAVRLGYRGSPAADTGKGSPRHGASPPRPPSPSKSRVLVAPLVPMARHAAVCVASVPPDARPRPTSAPSGRARARGPVLPHTWRPECREAGARLRSGQQGAAVAAAAAVAANAASGGCGGDSTSDVSVSKLFAANGGPPPAVGMSTVLEEAAASGGAAEAASLPLRPATAPRARASFLRPQPLQLENPMAAALKKSNITLAMVSGEDAQMYYKSTYAEDFPRREAQPEAIHVKSFHSFPTAAC